MTDSRNSAMMSEILNNTLGGVNGPLYYFYNLLYGIPTDIGEFSPDISGYTLIFMKPPHLSGYGYSEDFGGPLGIRCKAMCFLAIDFTPPNIQLVTSELPTHTGSLPFGMEVTPNGQLSITFIDNSNQHMFGFHQLWIHYIEDILRGKKTSNNQDINPSDDYITGSKSGELDYATSAYVLRTKPTMYMEVDDINYVGKATGIFPIGLPDKEVIGRRDSNELVMIPITYACAHYRQYTVGSPNNDQEKYIYNELMDLISLYGGSTLAVANFSSSV